MMEWRRLVVRVWKYQGAVLEAVGFAALWVVLTLEARTNRSGGQPTCRPSGAPIARRTSTMTPGMRITESSIVLGKDLGGHHSWLP